MELDNLVALVRDEIKNNKKTKSGIKSYRTIKDKSDLLRKNEPMAHNDPDMYDVKFVSGLTEGEEDNNKTLRSKIANHYNVSLSKLSTLKLDGTDSTIKLSRALNLPIDDTNFEGVKETIRKLSESENELTEGEENDYYIVGQLKNSFSQVFGEETFGDDTEEYDLMQSLDDETSEKLIDDLERQGITVAYDEADDSLTVVNHGKPNKEAGIEINEEEKTDEYKYRIITPEGKIKYAGTDESSWLSLKEAKRKVDRSKGEMIYEFDKKGNRMWEVLDENINEETTNDELQEGFDDEDFEQYVKNHLLDIDDNMDKYDYDLSDLSKMYNYYDLAHLLDADTRIMKDVDVSYWSNFLRQLMEEYLHHHKEENEEELNESTSEKEPWQMTKDEFYDFYGGDSNFGNLITARGDNKLDLDDFTESEYRRFKEAKRLAKVKATDVLPLLDKAKNKNKAIYHYTIIKNALKEDKPIPPEVLKDYPELQKEEELNESTSEKEPWQIRRDDLEFLSSRMWFNKLTKTEQQFIKDKIKTTDNIINLSEEENNILNTIKLKLENNGKLPKPKKEFWQMTYHQFVSMMGGAGRYSDLNLKETHFDNVEQALAEGKPVPPEVLKDYPELQKEDFDLTKFRITNVKQLREDLKR